MALQNEIDIAKKQIHADGYPMSIGEVISLYEKEELEIQPAFQRFFRWNMVQKSKLIESILLGIPIPSIFVSQREDGVWDVVDGLQRLSTILEFVGVLRGEDGKPVPPAQLHKTEYLESLGGKYWDSKEDPNNSFTAAQRMAFKREKLDVKIIKKESDKKTKFELFQRLNTLGTALTAQEVRNCLLIMLNPDFHKYLLTLATTTTFQTSISLSDRQDEQRYDMELVLKYLTYKIESDKTLKEIDEVGEFLTEKMKDYAQNTDAAYWAKEKQNFENTFMLLEAAMGDDAFRRYDASQDRFLGGFLVSAFEAIAIGVGHNIEKWQALTNTDDKHKRLKAKIKELWGMDEFKRNSGAGINSVARANALVPLGKRILIP